MATNKHEQQDRALLNAYINFVRYGRVVPEQDVINDLFALRRYERALSKINENEANGWPREIIETRDGKKYRYSVPDQVWQERDQKREAKVQAAVREIIAKYGFGVRFDGDPRGAAIRILGLDANNLGGDYGVYW